MRALHVPPYGAPFPPVVVRTRPRPTPPWRRTAGAALATLAVASCTPSDHQGFETATIAPVETPIAVPRPAVAAEPAAAPATVAAATALPKPVPAVRETAAQKVAGLAAAISTELSQRCPMAAPGEQAAFESCKTAMYAGSKLRKSLAPFTLWGRQHKNPEASLKETTLTQFGPDALTGMYLPLFMFSGKHAVTYSESEKLYRVELGARFRNRLQPGQFPYPFWHEDDKWKTYEDANAIILWVDPKQMIVRVAQFSRRGTLEPAAPNETIATPKFDGRWMWTDTDGRQQPKVTLFDGIFRADNPYLKKLDGSYRELALSLREGQCMACHVPNNPNKTKRLVLLQTPAHAAAEIKRVMASVSRCSMPVNEISGVEEPLTGELKGTLLRRAAQFEKLVDAAKAWEAMNAAKARPAASPQASPPAPKRSASAAAVE